jgi:hypothetical protein
MNTKFSVGKLERKRSFGKTIHRWQCNIKIDLKETGSGNADWTHLGKGGVQWWAAVDTVMIVRVSKKGWRFLDQLSKYHLLRKDSAP